MVFLHLLLFDFLAPFVVGTEIMLTYTACDEVRRILSLKLARECVLYLLKVQWSRIKWKSIWIPMPLGYNGREIYARDTDRESIPRQSPMAGRPMLVFGTSIM